MIAVDTNLLVYAHRKDSEWNHAAFACIQALAENGATWAIPWPCIHEFMAVVTHPRIYRPPSTLEAALHQVQAWLASPSLVLLGEGEGYLEHLALLAVPGNCVGPRIHDARIAALCRYAGVRELWSADRDFSRLGVPLKNPLLTSP